METVDERGLTKLAHANKMSTKQRILEDRLTQEGLLNDGDEPSLNVTRSPQKNPPPGQVAFDEFAQGEPHPMDVSADLAVKERDFHRNGVSSLSSSSGSPSSPRQFFPVSVGDSEDSADNKDLSAYGERYIEKPTTTTGGLVRSRIGSLRESFMEDMSFRKSNDVEEELNNVKEARQNFSLDYGVTGSAVLSSTVSKSTTSSTSPTMQSSIHRSGTLPLNRRYSLAHQSSTDSLPLASPEKCGAVGRRVSTSCLPVGSMLTAQPSLPIIKSKRSGSLIQARAASILQEVEGREKSIEEQRKKLLMEEFGLAGISNVQ